MKPKPSSSIERAIRSGGCSSEKPSASSTSAEPDADETARLPCFATPAPAAAATSAAAVEMLNVLAPSPPVPAVSTRSSRCGVHRRATCSRIASAQPAISSGGLALQPQRDEEAADLRRRRLAAHDLVHHLARLRTRARSRPSSSARERLPGSSRGSSAPGRGPSGVSTLSGWNWTPSIGSSRWRTPITSPSGVRAVTSSSSGNASRGERVVAAGLEVAAAARRRRPCRRASTRDALPCSERLRLADLAAERLDDRLVAEADAERRDARPEPADQLDRDARVLRPAGAGGDDEVRRLQRLGLVDRDRVVPEHAHLGAELLEQVRRGCR